MTLADIKTRLNKQDYILASRNKGGCFLYGYASTALNYADMLVIADKKGSSDFIYSGTVVAAQEARNVTAISCVPGNEGVTGGTWAGYQWLNLIP